MRRTLFAGLAMLAAGTPAAAQQPPPDPPILQVGLYGYRPDGTVSATAYDTPPGKGSTVYLSRSGDRVCGMGAGRKEAGDTTTDAWQFSSQVSSSSPEEVVVDIEWQRSRADGVAVGGPTGATQLRLRPGDRVLLDSATPASSCWTTVGFEARYMSSPLRRIVRLADGKVVGVAGGGIASGQGRGGAGTGGGIGSGGGAGSGGGVGSGGGIGAGVGAGTGSGSGGGLRGVGTARASGGASPAARTAAGPGRATDLFSVDLWLVRSTPGKADEVLHQQLRAPRDGAAFAFSPVTIAAPQGLVVVQVTGSFLVTASAAGEDQLVFTTNRRVTSPSSAPMPRDAVPDAVGWSKTTNRMPGPEDVLSFEMPPVSAGKGQPPLADRFSLRLRMTPGS